MSLLNRVLTASLATVLFATLVSIANYATAHHTYVTKYDAKKLISLKGTISSVNYRNPHIFFDVTAANQDGSTTTWQVETESISKAQAKGLTETKLRLGASVRVTGWRARDGGAELGLKSIQIGSRDYNIRRTPR